MGNYHEYSAIKQLIDRYFVLHENKRYEDFIRELTGILNI